MDTDIWYSFAVYVPNDFPIEDVRLVIGQWKQSSWTLWKKHSPVVAQRFRDGVFSVTLDNDEGQYSLYEVGTPEEPALIGRWTEFVYHMRFSKSENGKLEVWMDGQQIVEYSGQLAYSDDLNATYFRMGLYRDTMERPMTALFDDFAVSRRAPHDPEDSF